MKALKANFPYPQAPIHFPRFSWTVWQELTASCPYWHQHARGKVGMESNRSTPWLLILLPVLTFPYIHLDLGSTCATSFLSLWFLLYTHIANFPSSLIPATKGFRNMCKQELISICSCIQLKRDLDHSSPHLFKSTRFLIHNYQFTYPLFLICLPRKVLKALDPVPSHFPHLLVYFICLFYHHHNLYLRKQDSVYYLHAFPRSLWVKTRSEITVSCIEIWIKSWDQIELKTNGLMH